MDPSWQTDRDTFSRWLMVAFAAQPASSQIPPLCHYVALCYLLIFRTTIFTTTTCQCLHTPCLLKTILHMYLILKSSMPPSAHYPRGVVIPFTPPSRRRFYGRGLLLVPGLPRSTRWWSAIIHQLYKPFLRPFPHLFARLPNRLPSICRSLVGQK